jgi:hypothetical protein
MIFEIAAVLFLIYGLRVLSRLLARWRDVFSFLRRATWRALPGEVQRSAASPGVEFQSPDDRRSKLFHQEDGWRLSVTTDRQRRDVGADERVCSGRAESIGRKPSGQYTCEPPSGRLFRPCKRPPLGPGSRTKLPL